MQLAKWIINIILLWALIKMKINFMTWHKKTSHYVKLSLLQKTFPLEAHIFKRMGINHLIKIVSHSHLVTHEYTLFYGTSYDNVRVKDVKQIFRIQTI